MSHRLPQLIWSEVKARVPNRMMILTALIDFKYGPKLKRRQPHDLLLTLTANDWNQSTSKASESSLFTEVRENVKRQAETWGNVLLERVSAEAGCCLSRAWP